MLICITKVHLLKQSCPSNEKTEDYCIMILDYPDMS